MKPYTCWRKQLVIVLPTRSYVSNIPCPLNPAGMLEYIREKFANPPSRDLSREMLTMFADLMRVSL